MSFEVEPFNNSVSSTDHIGIPPRNIDYVAAQSRLDAEYSRRVMDAGFGGIDLALAAKSVPATAILGVLQRDAHANPWAAEAADSFFVDVATLPVEWPAVSMAVGAFALVSAGARIVKAEKFNQEAAVAVEQLQRADVYIPETPKQAFLRRAKEKTVRGVLTAAACFGAYKLGTEVGSDTQDHITGFSLIASSVAFVGLSRLRNRKKFPELYSRR